MSTEIQNGVKDMKTKNILFKVFIILSIGWAIAIFILSNQVKSTSDSLSMKVTKVVMKFMPEERQIEYENSFNKRQALNIQIRKITHFLLYFTGGVIITVFVSMSNMKTLKIIIVSSLFGILYACTDELHQYFVSGRGAQIKDVVIDSMGFILAEVMVIIIYLLKKKRVV